MILPRPFHALVWGSSGTLGQAFLRYLEQDPDCAQVLGISRTAYPAFELRDPENLTQVIDTLRVQAPFHLVIDATGALTVAGRGPEKSLKAVEPAGLMEALQINTVGPTVLMQQCAPLLAPGVAVYAKLSARVGSIADNRSGGWYSYRASKAAMNMLLHSAALEWQRRQPKWRVVALQPGTVRSRLSAPFTRDTMQVLEPDASVAGLMHVLKTLPTSAGAQFLDYRGQSIPW
jgi:NAD(P)-dependent dehydrogenase (short-subunit alcohol dehydrogenase family)